MNNTSNFNTYTSAQSASTHSSTDDSLQGLFALGSVGIMLAIAVLIIWIWSMISMISLNARFKDFYTMYMNQEKERTIEAEEGIDTHNELVVEPMVDNTEVQQKKKVLNKKPSGLLVIVLGALILAFIAMMLFFRL